MNNDENAIWKRVVGYFSTLIGLGIFLSVILQFPLHHTVIGVLLIGTTVFCLNQIEFLSWSDSYWKNLFLYTITLIGIGVLLAVVLEFSVYYTVPSILMIGCGFYALNR